MGLDSSHSSDTTGSAASNSAPGFDLRAESKASSHDTVPSEADLLQSYNALIGEALNQSKKAPVDKLVDKHHQPLDHTSDKASDVSRLGYLQQTLINFIPVINSSPNGQIRADINIATEAQQSGIRDEATRGQFGPQTKAAYTEYVNWLEQKALPEAKRVLRYVGLPEREYPNAGVIPPADRLGLDTSHPPDEAQLRKLDDAVRWTQRVDDRVQAAKVEILKEVDGNYATTVSALGLPRGWLHDIDRDHDRWRQSVGFLINGAVSARSNIEILDELNRGGGQIDLSSVLGSSAKLHRDETGKLASIHLNLPDTWDLNQPENSRRADDLNRLVAETNALVAPSRTQLRDLVSRPELAINWGDSEVKGMQGHFDAAGRLLGLKAKGEKLAKGEHASDVNLVESRFSTENKDGKVILHQHVQAQSVPWWGYQNLIGVQDVGRPTEITRSFNPTDNVIVRTESGYEVKQARDLDSYRNWQIGKHYGEKILMGALDVGMVASGTIELGAAYRAGRATGLGLSALDLVTKAGAKAVTGEGLEVSGRLLSAQAGKGLLRTTVGATGVFNNAGARESSLGQGVNTARSVYFLSDAALGLGRGGIKVGRNVFGLSKADAGALTDATAARSPLAGLTPGTTSDAFYRFNHKMFRASEIGFIPLAISDASGGISRLRDDASRHIARAAEIVVNDDQANAKKQ